MLASCITWGLLSLSTDVLAHQNARSSTDTILSMKRHVSHTIWLPFNKTKHIFAGSDNILHYRNQYPMRCHRTWDMINRMKVLLWVQTRTNIDPGGLSWRIAFYSNDCVNEFNANYNGEQFIIMAALHYQDSSTPFSQLGITAIRSYYCSSIPIFLRRTEIWNPQFLCPGTHFKNIFQNYFTFGHMVYWDISADVIENQHQSSPDMCIMTQ